jgi:hypothetical protein
MGRAKLIHHPAVLIRFQVKVPASHSLSAK